MKLLWKMVGWIDTAKALCLYACLYLPMWLAERTQAKKKRWDFRSSR
jgi:hypothetical protein